MDATSWARDLWRRPAGPGGWSRARAAGECALAGTLGLLAAAPEALARHGWLRTTAVGVVVAVLSLLRRALPATVLVLAGALSAVTS
ncbi:sensor histidine kinase, partial [Streptomyces sp. NPDC049577]